MNNLFTTNLFSTENQKEVLIMNDPSLSNHQINQVLKITKKYVKSTLQEINFDPSVKEPGHSFGEKFEEVFVKILVEKHSEIFSLPIFIPKKGKQTRKMEDFLVFDKHTNVKFGLNKKGQSNVCSFNRLLEKYHNNEIDSYWVCLINVLDINYNFDLYFFNVYDYIDCLHYDYGTGQVMLKESIFFERYKSNLNKKFLLTKKDHMSLLKSMNDIAFARHMKKKIKQNEERTRIFNEYK